MTTDLQYPEEFTDRLELIWGEGFLSPGGADEVWKILEGIDIQDKDLLDIGCGTGGVELLLGNLLGSGTITGIDVEPQLISCTSDRIQKAGLSGAVQAMLVEPGPLDFADNAFDIVFSKDSLIHIPDKPALFAEILRVLRPGGVFAASDWLAGEDADELPEWQSYLEMSHLSFRMATASEMVQAMEVAGFETVSCVDRNEWYAPITVEEVNQLEGPLMEDIIRVSSEEIYQHWIKVRRSLRDTVNAGALRPTHLRGFAPA